MELPYGNRFELHFFMLKMVAFYTLVMVEKPKYPGISGATVKMTVKINRTKIVDFVVCLSMHYSKYLRNGC